MSKSKYFPKKKDRRAKRIKRYEAKQKVKAKILQQAQPTPVFKAPEPLPSKQQKAKTLNNALEFASDKFGNRDDYSKYLVPMLHEIDNNFDMLHPEAGDYEGFTVSDDFDGNNNNLFKYVTFKEIPDDPRIDSFMDILMSLDWSTPEAYDKHKADINAKIYKANVASLGIDPNNSYFFYALEAVMQSSAAWAIAKKNTDDSDQKKLNWELLYTTGLTAFEEKAHPEIWDRFTSMVFNYEDLDKIIDTIDDMIYSIVKG